MHLPDDFAACMDQERAVDHARVGFQAQEAGRLRGVAWSGLEPAQIQERTDDRLAAAARVRLAAAQAWRASPQGAFLSAVAAAQRILAEAHATAEWARAGAARGLIPERGLCEQALSDLHRQSQALSRSLGEARRALDGADLGGGETAVQA